MRLETTRLILQTPTCAAYVAFRAAADDPIRDEAAAALLAKQRQLLDGATGWLSLALYFPNSARIIGEVGAFFDSHKPGQADIGWSLLPSCRGQGLAHEAATHMIAWLFENRRLHRLTAGCRTDNAASWRLMDRLGMRRETETRQSCQENGKWCDEFGYALLADEWRALNLPKTAAFTTA